MYSIIELQTNGDTTAHLCFTAASRYEAMSKYHSVLAAAAISSIDYHACVVLNEAGVSIARECYIHAKDDQTSEE